MTTRTRPSQRLRASLLPALLLALGGLSACGGADDGEPEAADTRAAAAEPDADADAATTEPPAPDATEGQAEDVAPGSPEQVEAIRACLEEIGLPVKDTPAPTRPEQKLSIGPVTSGPDESFEAQVFVFGSEAEARDQRAYVTFFDDDTAYDTLVGNVLVAYFPAPSEVGGLEAGIDACLV